MVEHYTSNRHDETGCPACHEAVTRRQPPWVRRVDDRHEETDADREHEALERTRYELGE